MANLSNINNKFLVTTTGEVLVGRTAATGTSKLQVSGSLLIGTDINSGIPLVVQETTADGFAIGFMRNTNATSGNGLVIDVNSTGGAYIQDWRQASTVKMRLLQNGNLGIGTDSPVGGALIIDVSATSAIADISAQATNTIAFNYNDASAIVGKSTADNTNGLYIVAAASDTNSKADFLLNVREDNNSDFSTLTTRAFDFTRWTTSLMTILRNGNVGIGTTGPDAKLTVDSTTAPQLLLTNTGGGNSQILMYDNSGGTQNASITFDQAGENQLYITTNYVSPSDSNRILLQPGGSPALTAYGGANGSINTKVEISGTLQANKNIQTPNSDLSTGANPTSFGVYSSEIRLIQTPNGGLKQCRVITDSYGEWILVGRFAANAMTTIQGVWSSESGLDTSTSQSTTTKFSADFGDSYPTEVRIMGATDFTKWRDTRTVDFVYGVPEGRQWKYFFSGGATNGMTVVGPNHSGNNKFGWGINGSYDGFGRWVNPIQTSVGMSDTNVTNPSAAYTTATANAFNWELASDAKITVSATRTFSGQDSYLTAGFGNDDNIQGFFDAYPSEVTNMQGGTGFSSAAWVLIKLPNFSSGYSGGVNQSEASLWTVKAIQSNVVINGTITLSDLTHTYTFNGPHALYISGGFTTTPTTVGVTYAAHFSMYVDGNLVGLADQHDTPPEWWRQSFAFMTPNYTSGQHTITVTGTNQSGNFNIVGTTQYSQIVYRIIPL